MTFQLLTVLAAILTATGLILNIHKIKWCFPIWILGNFVWFATCIMRFNAGIALSNIVFLGLNATGWWKWSKKVH